MRTTVRLDARLLEQAKREAARRGETLTSLIAQGLRLVLAGTRTRHAKTRVQLPVSRKGGGLQPGITLDDTAALLDAMDDLS